VWRVIFVSLIFLVGALAIFFYALNKGLDVDTARTMVVNTIIVLEIFYLFNVRYLHATSFTWRGALGTPPVLIAVGIVVAAQLAFTYWPVMHHLFATKPVALPDGLLIIGVGVVAMIVLEAEKHLMRRLGVLTTYG
jgi:magnesium-transporting ATPase (P-type)